MKSLDYFLFEADFVEDNIRCIPMIVRFKLDLVGIKMALSTWCKCTEAERHRLSILPCESAAERQLYYHMLENIIIRYTGKSPVLLEVDAEPAWQDEQEIPIDLQQQARMFGWTISIGQWKHLGILQRFALLKLCRPGHENRNFPVAMHEFGLAGVIENKLP